MVAPAGAKHSKIRPRHRKRKDKKGRFNNGKSDREKCGAARKRICRIGGKQRWHHPPATGGRPAWKAYPLPHGYYTVAPRKRQGEKNIQICRKKEWEEPLFSVSSHRGATKTVSRVLFSAVIYLGPPLPEGSSHLLGTAGPACVSPHGVAPNRVYSIGQSPADG